MISSDIDGFGYHRAEGAVLEAHFRRLGLREGLARIMLWSCNHDSGNQWE